MVLMVFNTLGRRKEEFIPLRKGEVHMYVCGPTVYDLIHIGNARAFVVADVVRRYLEYKGYKVNFVSNITDVDDKSIRRAKEKGTSLQQLGEVYGDAYFEDIAKLNIKKPDVNPRATQHISEIIDLVQTLIAKGYAYRVDGDIYYDVSKFEEYGKLSGNKAEALMLGARIEVNPKKRNPADSALWKGQRSNEPAWHSPWGLGRPGWHVECSAMAMKYLSASFDVHMGGKDLIFPHHENEIAQSEAATGRFFARYWLHNEWLTVSGEKMSKSLGNFVTVRDALAKWNPQVLRFFLIFAHYRSPVDFNDEGLTQAERNLERILEMVEKLEALKEREYSTGDDGATLAETERAKERFEEAMDNDFNTPLAISALLELVKVINSHMEKYNEIGAKVKERMLEIVNQLLGVLGIEVKEGRPQLPQQSESIQRLISLILKIRQQARDKKEWETADMIRHELESIGFVIQDTPEGTKWRAEQS